MKNEHGNTKANCDILQKKRLLRTECKRRVSSISFDTFCVHSQKIFEKLYTLTYYQNAKTVFCFVGTKSEVQTENFINSALLRGKTVCVPLCTTKPCTKNGKVEAGEMFAVKIDNTAQLQVGYYGIKEPPSGNAIINKSEIDLIILPCLAAEKTGARLGYGGGFYDNFMTQLPSKCKKALVCTEELLLPTGTIPMQAHDIFADFVITQNDIFVV